MTSQDLVRPVTIDDAEAIQEIYAPYVQDTVISFEVTPPTVAEIKARIAEITPKYPWLVFESRSGGSAEILGYAYASQYRSREAYRWSADVGIYVRQGHFQRGIGKILYQKLFDQLASLGYANAFAGISLPNAASVALHEAMGFQLIGIYRKVGFKLGAWHDVGWWQLSFEHPAMPEEPKTIG